MLYRDPAAAARWITEVLGFCEAIRFTAPDGGAVAHVELERDGAVLMLGLAGSRLGETASITLVFVDDTHPAHLRCHAGRLGGRADRTATGLTTSETRQIPRILHA